MQSPETPCQTPPPEYFSEENTPTETPNSRPDSSNFELENLELAEISTPRPGLENAAGNSQNRGQNLALGLLEMELQMDSPRGIDGVAGPPTTAKDPTQPGGESHAPPLEIPRQSVNSCRRR